MLCQKKRGTNWALLKYLGLLTAVNVGKKIEKYTDNFEITGCNYWNLISKFLHFVIDRSGLPLKLFPKRNINKLIFSAEENDSFLKRDFRC
ncbi:hypothetical protein CLU99_3302 [Flavobacterium sp. 2]|nr:hypothetical protein CLU99_3302 [Flavobacterium sp. 2]